MRLKPSYPRLRHDHPLANGLVGAWLMTEGSGGRLRNAVGDANLDATTVNTPEWSGGNAGYAFGGNGTGYARVEHSSLLDLTEVTISAYVMRTGTPGINAYVFGREVSLTPTNVPYRAYYVSSALLRLGFFAESDNFIEESGGIGNGANNNQWFFYQLRILSRLPTTGSFVHVFRDGVEIGNLTTTQTPPTRVSPFFIGAENERRYFPGKIGALWMHNRGLRSETGELAEMADDPFAMFRPRQRSYFFFRPYVDPLAVLIADAVWMNPTRTVDAGSPAVSDSSYIDDIGYAVWTAGTRVLHDPDAASYIAVVEDADGATLPTYIKAAINSFVIELKTELLWEKISVCSLWAGPATLAGSHVPLKGPRPTFVGFSAGHHSQSLGLLGGDAARYVRTGYFGSSVLDNDVHGSIYISEVATSQSTAFGIGSSNAPVAGFTSTSGVANYSQNSSVRWQASNASRPAFTNPGLFAYSRNGVQARQWIDGAETSFNHIYTNPTLDWEWPIFARSNTVSTFLISSVPSRIGGFTIGPDLDMSKLSTAFDNYMTALAPPSGVIQTRRRRYLGGYGL